VVTSRAARISALPKEPKRLTKGHGGRGQGGLNGTRSSVWSDPDTALRLMIHVEAVVGCCGYCGAKMSRAFFGSRCETIQPAPVKRLCKQSDRLPNRQVRRDPS
jgi:hypothetical protein